MKIKPHQIPQLATGMARARAAADQAKKSLTHFDDAFMTGSIFTALPIVKKPEKKKEAPANSREVSSDMLEALKKKFGV